MRHGDQAMQTGRSKPLARLLEEHRERVIERWTQALRRRPGSPYAALPPAEVEKLCRLAFQACLAAMIPDEGGQLDAVLGNLLLWRASFGVRIGEMHRAFFALKEILWPVLVAEYGDNGLRLAVSARKLDRWIHRVIERIDAFDEEAHRRFGRLLEVSARETHRLRERSVQDSLTGLFNHAFFQRRLREEVKWAIEHDEPLALLMIDVDYFKEFNDRYGHPAGDHLLRAAAQTFRQTVRTIDVVARYGGEEFAVILPGTAAAEAIQVAERVRQRFASLHYRPEGEVRPIQLTASIGVASLPADATTALDLVAAADRALYQAKRLGRNRVVANTPLKVVGEHGP